MVLVGLAQSLTQPHKRGGAGDKRPFAGQSVSVASVSGQAPKVSL